MIAGLKGKRARLSVSIAVGALSGDAGTAVAGPQNTSRTAESVAGKQLAQSFYNLSGTWRGRYFYNNGQRPVPFVARLRDNGGFIRGRMREPNTFGRPGARFLSAFLRGRVTGRRVRLVKTYDGRGGQRHSVFYNGRLRRGGTVISGFWRLGGASGRFFMTRR